MEPVAARADDPSPTSAILQEVLKLTRRAAPPKCWPILKSTPSVRKLPCEPAELVTQLTARFPIDQLQASRIVVAGANGQFELSPVFGGPAAKFVILRNPAGEPQDAISARGQLSQSTPAVLRYSQGPRMQLPNVASHKLFLAESDDDMHVLHALGQEFTTAAGIGTFKPTDIRYSFMDCQSGFVEALVIPAWQIARLGDEPTATTLEVLTHLERIERESGLRPWGDLLRVWCPTEDQFRALRWAAANDHQGAVAEFTAGLKQSSCTIVEAVQFFRDREDVDYGTARDRLTRALQLSHKTRIPHVAEVRAARDQMNRAFRSDVIDKFHHAVSGDGDGFEQLRVLMASELAELWYQGQDVIVAARTLLAGEFPCECGAIDLEALNDRLRLVDAFTKLYGLRGTQRRCASDHPARQTKSASSIAHLETKPC